MSDVLLLQFLQLVPADGCPEAPEDVCADFPGAVSALGGGEFVVRWALEAGVGQPGELRFGFSLQKQN